MTFPLPCPYEKKLNNKDPNIFKLKFMMKANKLFLLIISILLLLNISAIKTFPSTVQQENGDDYIDDVNALFDRLSPEEKVGQLFIVSFQGIDLSEQSQIRDLIINHYIGGVILTRANNNFVGLDETLNHTYELISNLQNTAWQKNSAASTGGTTTTPTGANYIPLFIAISQEGDSFPNDQIINGMTPLPNEMTIGATWNLDLAREIGKILGSELNALGINMLIGPSLDVLNVIQTESGEDLGTRTFGGDPFWVGSLGQAYIQGLHAGGLNSLAVIAKHFPGRGSSDRPPEEEVATVRKSLESLKQIELFPFFSVTGNSPNSQSTTDGLLVSHIRYQGFQGNIRAITIPISFDRASMEQILSLQPFQTWRLGGGVMVCDNLGSESVRKFYDPTGLSFDGRQVARNAFLGGNDLMILDNFVSKGDPDQTATLLKTLVFFTQKYKEDPAFAEKVDQSVRRILKLKYKLYPYFDLSNVLSNLENLGMIGQSSSKIFNVAKSAVTLVSPSMADLPILLPHSPMLDERILFITDDLHARQCTECNPMDIAPVDALDKAVLKLYGPQASGQVREADLVSYSFINLQHWLKEPWTEPDFSMDIKSSDWIIFSMLGMTSNGETSNSLKDLLNSNYESIRNKKIIVFSFTAPYYLDATDISKILAYYALYSKTPVFFDVAARVLFQELSPTGSSPVSIPGTGYDLITAVSPNPSQTINLSLDLPGDTSGEGTPTPENPVLPLYFIGDTIPLKTGKILDHNGHTVPDGTVVRFVFSNASDASASQQLETTTVDGIARTSYRLLNPGVLEVRVTSDPAMISDVLRLEIKEGEAAVITAIAPTPGVTPTIFPNNPSTTSGNSTIDHGQITIGINLLHWFIGVILVSMGTVLSYRIGLLKINRLWGIRWGLSVLIGGFLAYSILIASLSGTIRFTGMGLALLVAITCIGGSLLGWICGWLWHLKYSKSSR
jgi:beta-N-acetylhexosaminidase